MKNVLVTLKIYLKENLNYSSSCLDLSTFFYISGAKISWTIVLPNIVIAFEPGYASDHLEVLYKNADHQSIPRYFH